MLKAVGFSMTPDRSFSAVGYGVSQSHLVHLASFFHGAKKAEKALGTIFAVLHRSPLLQPDEGDMPEGPLIGELTFNNLHFRYPTRKTVPVLRVRRHRPDWYDCLTNRIKLKLNSLKNAPPHNSSRRNYGFDRQVFSFPNCNIEEGEEFLNNIITTWKRCEFSPI